MFSTFKQYINSLSITVILSIKRSYISDGMNWKIVNFLDQ